MSSAKRNAAITAVVLIIVGLILCWWVYRRIGGDLTKLNTAHFEPKTYEVTEAFRSVDIRETDFDVNIVLLEDDGLTGRVETAESNGNTNTVRVEDGTLKIAREDTRRWYDHIGFSWNDAPSITTVYLPSVWFERIDDSYDDMNVTTVSGDVSIQRGFDFKNVEITTVSGDVDLRASVSRDWSIKTTSGEVDIHNTGGLHGSIKTASGDVRVANSYVDILSVVTASGEVRLDNTSTGQTAITTVSGDIELLHPGSRELTITTVSGDVEGSIGSGWSFEVSTVSGETELPYSDPEGYPCRIKTTSGDIELK